MLYEVIAEYGGDYSQTQRHTEFTREHAERMVHVHEEECNERGKPLERVTIESFDIDPTRLVLVVGEGETIDRCPSYYAADHETLALEPGEYPLRPSTVDGRNTTWDDAYWIGTAVPAVRVSGAMYSGFGGVNFASKELPRESVTYHWSVYSYTLGELIESGKVREARRENNG